MQFGFFKFLITVSLLTLVTNSILARDESDGKNFTQSTISGWKEIIFEGKTTYTLTEECVLADSKGSASGLISEQRRKIDANSILQWAWKADAMMAGNNFSERTKQGDDFLVRVYVIHEGRFFWQTKALNYVWSREEQVDADWANPFTSNARMIVVQSGKEQLGQWNHFERNIKSDFKQYFDMDVEKIDAIALMTDTDNSGGQAKACYRLPELKP